MDHQNHNEVYTYPIFAVRLSYPNDVRQEREHSDDYAKERGVLWARYAADWKSYGKSAGMMRNRIMLDQEPDYVVGFFGGVGTAGMIAISKAAGVPTFHIKG